MKLARAITGRFLISACFLMCTMQAKAQLLPGYLDMSPADPGALPTDRARMIQPVTSIDSIETNPFNEYVPGLQSRHYLTLNPVLSLPYLHVPYLRRGKEPADRANIAIPEWLYIDLHLSADFMFTDNVWRDNNNRKSDLVIQTVLTIDTTLQLTENLKLQAAANIVYHRAMGEDSISGFGFQDYFYFDDTFQAESIFNMGGNTLFATQMEWSRQFGLWELLVSDRFHIASRMLDDPFVDGRAEQTTETANLFNTSLGRLLPGPSRLGMGVARGDYWYNNKFKNYARAENSATIWFDVQRETMRFTPFAYYTVRHLEYTRREQDGLIQQGSAGMRGPVTDQMNLEGSVGYAYVDDDRRSKSEEWLWRLRMDHLMNRTTRHQLLLERHLTPSADTLQGSRTFLQYKIGHNFRPNIVAWLGCNKTLYDDSAKDQRDTEKWTLLASTGFSPARRMHCTLEYQYVDWTTNRDGEDYTENRITLSVTWDI